MFKRNIYKEVLNRLSEKRRFIQVLAGPRQTGKTTIARQVLDAVDFSAHYATADEPMLKDTAWIEQQWEVVRAKLDNSGKKALFILDEAQKIPGWSEMVKRLWDEDTAAKHNIYMVLLGSSPLLVQKGLAESLAGRFEIINVTHWSFKEMNQAFGWDRDEYIFFGGYPGSHELIKDKKRWSNYILESLVETTLSRDILLMTRVDKPALLRRLFELGCSYSGQMLSYQKMLGQLQDAGNTTTLAHYLDLLEGAGLLAGLSKYSGQVVRQRASSPKLQVLNNALMTAQLNISLKEAKKDNEFWGRLVESAVGASLVNGIKGTNIKLYYWSGDNHEVDFILSSDKSLIAIEVKTGRKKSNLPGIGLFSKRFKTTKKLLVGDMGIPVSDFLKSSPEDWF